MVKLNFYDQFIEYVGDHSGATDGIDLNNDTFKIELYNSTHSFDATDQARADVSANAVATGGNYTNPGQDLTTVAWTNATGTSTWDADDNTWSASGDTIPAVGNAGYALIYDDTSVTPFVDLLVCEIDFEGTEEAGDGTNFVITFNGSGIFTIS